MNKTVNGLYKIAIGMILPMVILTGCKKEDSVSNEPEIGVIVTEGSSETTDFESDAKEAVNYESDVQEAVNSETDAKELLEEGILTEDIAMEESEQDTSSENLPDGEVFVDETASGDDGLIEAGTSSGANMGTIVWLGDSLTQGSLGDDNDNFANAPYIKLAALCDRRVEGYGFYGYNTHDIFWVYTDESQENQKKDPAKTYIFWVGSNDWVVNGVTNDNADPVIAEIDRFISSGGITKYLVLGTTARYELRSDYEGFGGTANANMGKNMYESINDKLAQHYGNRYLDVNPAIPIEGGYGPDNIHLVQKSYDDVAELVNRKLTELGI